MIPEIYLDVFIIEEHEIPKETQKEEETPREMQAELRSFL